MYCGHVQVAFDVEIDNQTSQMQEFCSVIYELFVTYSYVLDTCQIPEGTPVHLYTCSLWKLHIHIGSSLLESFVRTWDFKSD